VKQVHLISLVCAFCSASTLAAQNPVPPESRTTMTIQSKAGPPEAVSVSVRVWKVSNEDSQIPLHGFYLARVVTGDVLATIDGRSAHHLPGEYWSVAAGSTMTVKTLGETAALETTAPSKP
jgi:hypothetical protein